MYRSDQNQRRVLARGALICCALGLAALAVPGLAQDDGKAKQSFWTFSQSLRATENIRLSEQSAGTTYASETQLSFGHEFESGIQSLKLSGSAVARLVDDPLQGSDNGLSDADARVTYLRDGANARLRLQSRYVRTDLAFDDPLAVDEITDEDLSNSGGRRNNFNNSLLFETGLQSPVGLNLRLSRQDRSYSGTTDPDLFDTVTENVQISTPFRLSDRTQARLTFNENRYRAEDGPGTNRDTTRITVGLDHRFSPITRLSLDLGHSEVVETFDTLPGLEDRDSGVVIGLNLVRDLPNGEIEASFDSDVTQEGRRRTFLLSRQLDLPNGGLSFALGAVDGSTTDTRAIGSIRYRRELDRTTFTAGLSRSGAISDTTSTVTETTRLNLGYALQLTEVASLSMDLRYANIADVGSGATEADRERTSFDVALNRQVTQDWDFVTGYQFRHSKRSSGTSGNSNAVFFTLKRDFGGLN